MVKVIKGHKGTGKTKHIVDLANETIDKGNGSVIFITKNQRLMYDLKHQIRVVCMEDFKHITNSDEYIGFVYGIVSGDHDIEVIFIDSILHHADFSLEDLPGFLNRLKGISEHYSMDIVVSVGAEMEEMGDVDFTDIELLN